MNILLVDDKQEILNSLVIMIEKYGHTVEVALNGLAAFEKAQTTGFDLFIIDHLMPVMNGLQLTKNLKQNESTKDIPIIFITTQDIKEVSLLPEAQVFSGLLPKPIVENSLMQLIETRSTANSLSHSL